MTEHDEKELEQYLARFKVKAAQPTLRPRVLAPARQAWAAGRRPRRQWFSLFAPGPLRNYACAAMILILVYGVSSSIDNRLTANLLDGDTVAVFTVVDRAELIAFYTELGADERTAQKYAFWAQVQREQFVREMFRNCHLRKSNELRLTQGGAS